MYKKILTILFIALFLTSISNGQDIVTGSGAITVVNSPKGDTVITETINANGIGTELGGVQLKFCNDGVENPTNKINGMINQMENGEICLLATNALDKDVEILVTFTDAIETSAGNLTCNVSNDNFFSKVISEPTSTIKVPSNNYNIKKYNIMFPLGTNGKQAGCLYYSVKKAKSDAGMINVIVGKTMFLDYFVGALGEIKNETKIKIFSKEINNNNEFIVKAGIENKGNIDLEMSIFGSMTNILGVNKIFNITGETVRTDDVLSFSLNFGQLPNYKGPFNIEIKATHKPFFDFDINGFDIDPELLEEKTTTFNSNYFEMPRLLIGGAVLIIGLFFLAIKKKKQQIVYVQQPTTNI